MTTLARPGVYAIRCTPTLGVYVGSTTDLQRRWRHHKADLRRGTNNANLQRLYAVYGIDAFTFEILEECAVPVLRAQEQVWIDRLGAATPPYGLNIAPRAGSNRGITRSPAACEKMRRAQLGKKRRLESVRLSKANHPLTKLNDALADEIRTIYGPIRGQGKGSKRPTSARALALKYGVSHTTVLKIIHGIRYPDSTPLMARNR